MSRRAAVAALEGIDSVGRTDVRLKPLTVDTINRSVEQAGNVVFQSRIVKGGNAGRRIKFNHDVAVGSIIAPRARTEQRGVPDTSRAQGRFIFPKLGEKFLTSHRVMIAGTVVFVRHAHGSGHPWRRARRL